MNALRTATMLRNSKQVVGRRLFSAVAVPKAPVPECYQYSFKKAFLSDPSTYPIMIIMGFASCFLVGMSANAFYHYKDLRIRPENKHQTLRDWGDEHYDPMALRFAKGPIIMHKKDIRSLWKEGLGVDHDEWKKAKEEAEKAL